MGQLLAELWTNGQEQFLIRNLLLRYEGTRHKSISRYCPFKGLDLLYLLSASYLRFQNTVPHREST